VNDLCGIKESDTGLSAPSQWDLVSDKQVMQEEQPLQVARCTKIISPGTEDAKYIINVKQIAKFVVALAEKTSPTDIEEGMRVGVDRTKYQIHIPLPAKIDPTVTMMTVEEKPDVTYADIGGSKEQIEKMREVVELPLLHPEKFVRLGIDPPKGVLCYGPPGTGKTLLARAVANRTDACFIRVIGSELVQKYVGEGARMVREIFTMARTKKACLIFFDEVDAIGGARNDDGCARRAGGPAPSHAAPVQGGGGQRGAAHDARDREPAGRLRRARQREGADGDEPARHAGPGAAAAGAAGPQG